MLSEEERRTREKANGRGREEKIDLAEDLESLNFVVTDFGRLGAVCRTCCVDTHNLQILQIRKFPIHSKRKNEGQIQFVSKEAGVRSKYREKK